MRTIYEMALQLWMQVVVRNGHRRTARRKGDNEHHWNIWCYRCLWRMQL